MNRESHDSKAIQTIHGAIQDIKRYINRYVSYKVIFETNRDTYRTIHMILTTMIWLSGLLLGTSFSRLFHGPLPVNVYCLKLLNLILRPST